MTFSADQAVADLQWLLDCPSLIDEGWNLSTKPSQVESWAPIERFLTTKAAHRVGYYMESLIQCALESDPAITDLRHSIQIIPNKETLGELDFLFRHQGAWHHLEVALKYYLYYPPRAENGSQWIGPNASDSFERKRDRLFEKQLPFGREQFPEIAHSTHLIKGMIFYPPDYSGDLTLPDQLNPSHFRGTWIQRKDLPAFLDQRASGRVLKKPYWLSSKESPQMNREEMLAASEDHFSRWSGPVFLSLDQSGVEEELRVFVVDNDWPDQAS